MEQTCTDKAPHTSGDEAVVLMYPGNQLKEQVREVSETLSVFTVLKDTFFPDK